MKKSINHKIILIIIVLISIYKLTLINKGFKTFPDEERYNQTGSFLKNLSENEPFLAVQSLFSTQGRPGEVLVKSIPLFFQFLSSKILGLEILEPDNSFPLFIFNFIVCGFILLVHYKFSNLFLKNKFLSLFSVLIYCCLIASYISLRHADPYDFSFLTLYFVLYKSIKYYQKETRNHQEIVYLGFVAFFGYLNYPGYILLYLTIAILISILFLLKFGFLTSLKKTFFFGLGSIICLGIFESLAWIVDKSYIKDAMILSKTIVQGSFEECYSFLFKYLIEVEGIIGFLLIIGIVFMIICTFKKDSNFTLKILFLIILIVFLSYATLGFFMHKVVLYARILRQFLPFLALFFVFGLNEFFKPEKYKNVVIWIIITICTINYFIEIEQYKSYFYAKDVVWELYKKHKTKNFEQQYEYENVYSSDLIYFEKATKNHPIKSNNKLILVNFGLYYPFDSLNKYHIYKKTANQKLILSLKNAVQYKAYLFEGFNIIERNNMKKVLLDLRVYKEN